MRWLRYLIVLLLLIISPYAYSSCNNQGVSVLGNTLRDSYNNVITLHGVDRFGSEYACIQGWGIFDSTINVTNDDVEIPFMKSWGVNAVTIGLNEDCWLNINMGASVYGGATYINAINHEVAKLEAYGIIPIISLFWNASGVTQATVQVTMPDSDHSPAFWQSVANNFKNDPKVIFRVKEETWPNGNTDNAAAWKCWNGGDIQYGSTGSLTPISSTANCSETFSTVGMQSLVNIIRGTGATNVIAISGIQFANTMTQFLNPLYRIVDTLNPPQLMASTDNYPETGVCETLACWNSQLLPILQTMPLWAGEVGENASATFTTTALVDGLMNWLDAHGAGYSAWGWNRTTTLNLITADGTGNPSALWGADYKAHIGAFLQ